MINPFILGY